MATFIPEEEQQCNQLKEISDSTPDGLNNFSIGFKFFFSSVGFMFRTMLCKVAIPECITITVIYFGFFFIYAILICVAVGLMFIPKVGQILGGLAYVIVIIIYFCTFWVLILAMVVIMYPVPRKLHIATNGEVQGKKSQMAWNFFKDIPKRVVIKFCVMYFLASLILGILGMIANIPVIGWILGIFVQNLITACQGYVVAYVVKSDLLGGHIFCYKHWKLIIGSTLASFIISFVPILDFFTGIISIISATRVLMFADRHGLNTSPIQENKDFPEFKMGKDEPEEIKVLKEGLVEQS